MINLHTVCLDYVESEKDLGIHITAKRNWKEHIYYLCSKANRMLGLVQRTCHFVKNSDQKKLLCTSLVLSQFNHFSQVWRPNSIALFNKIERVQIRAIKWILSEQYVTYSKSQYLQKCKLLDLLPLMAKLDFFSILLFHRIINNTVYIKLPNYINLVAPTILRYSHLDPLMFESSIKPRNTKKPIIKSTIKKKQTIKNINLTVKKKVVIKKKKKGKSFKKFKKRAKSERIYTAENPKKSNKQITRVIDEYSENKVFYSSYFYRTHMQWNNLPLNIRIIENEDEFKLKLKEHMWDEVLNHIVTLDNSNNNESDNDLSEQSFELPGD